jgi:ribosome-associated toxin RatA of RatAB toxin-antitoxin module
MTAHLDVAGGRTSVRRFLFAVGLLLAGAIPVTAIQLDDGSEAQRAVDVSEARGVYSVSARFQVPESPALAMAVLTDYEHIARFMPGVETSSVLERAGARALVQQEAVSRLMLFSRRVHLVLEITEGADTLRFRDRSGRSFTRYEGTWRLCEVRGGTEVQYELTADPSFDVPDFLLKRLLRRDSGEMIEALRKEITRRDRETGTRISKK